MQETAIDSITKLYNVQSAYFSSHKTRDVNFRVTMLKKLKVVIREYEDRILEALWKDLRKSKEEAYLTEISIVTQELDFHLRNLKKWAAPGKVRTPVHLQPSSGRIHYEPLGKTLIIAPWNYPFQLVMNPLIGAISAGCCAVLKPSEATPHTSAVMAQMISETFEEKYVALVQGNKQVGKKLLELNFDMIFFTGSTRVGRLVMKAAAEKLTPVILELGGKSPCIVDKSSKVDLAAKRIIWGKTINAGQTCIAPDYLLVHEAVKEELIHSIKNHLKGMFGENIEKSAYYPRIVHERSFDNLKELIAKTTGNIRIGGDSDRQDLFIAPTVVDEIGPEDILMQEEIFGPILPIMTYTHLEDAISFINSREKPLALYYFGKKKTGREVLMKTSSGGSCINDVLMHIGNKHLPFGGVGYSGMGKYHGKESFLAFSNQKPVVTTPTWTDLPFKYAPFKYFKQVKRIL